MRVCYCAIPAMGGSCEGCANNQPMEYVPYRFPQVGGPIVSNEKEFKLKIDELLELLRNRK